MAINAIAPDIESFLNGHGLYGRTAVCPNWSLDFIRGWRQSLWPIWARDRQPQNDESDDWFTQDRRAADRAERIEAFAALQGGMDPWAIAADHPWFINAADAETFRFTNSPFADGRTPSDHPGSGVRRKLARRQPTGQPRSRHRVPVLSLQFRMLRDPPPALTQFAPIIPMISI